MLLYVSRGSKRYPTFGSVSLHPRQKWGPSLQVIYGYLFYRGVRFLKIGLRDHTWKTQNWHHPTINHPTTPWKLLQLVNSQLWLTLLSTIIRLPQLQATKQALRQSTTNYKATTKALQTLIMRPARSGHWLGSSLRAFNNQGSVYESVFSQPCIKVYDRFFLKACWDLCA